MTGFASSKFTRIHCARKRLSSLGVMLVGVLCACAPALNCREVRGSQVDVVASFPCKPDVHVRQVSLDGLGGARLPMSLRVCNADGQTFAMMEVDVQEPARVPAAMKNLRLALSGNVSALPTSASRQEWAVKGMTPQPDGGRWQLTGALPSGRPVQAETGLVSRGTVIVQVNVSGPEIAPEATKQFFESFVFRSP